MGEMFYYDKKTESLHKMNIFGLGGDNEGEENVGGIVNTPSILSPNQNSQVIVSNNSLTVTSSAFVSTPEGDTHTATDWRITKDAKGLVSLKEDYDSEDLTEHTFTDLDVESDTPIYIWVRYHGELYKESSWSPYCAVTVKLGSIATPNILTPGSGENVYIVGGELTVTADQFSADPDEDSHASSDWKITSDSAGTKIIKEDLKSSDLTEHTFTGLNINDGTVVYLWVRYHGEQFGSSNWSPSRVIVCKIGYVNTPVILTPEQGADVTVADGTLTVTASSFSSVPNDDVHKSSDWKITTDAAGKQVLKEDLGSSDLTSHVFTDLSIEEEKTVYIWVRYNGTKFGTSAWSPALSIKVGTAIITAGGRKLWRHSSGKGSVLQMNDNGMIVNVFIRDAADRTKAKWCINTTTDITGLPRYTPGTKDGQIPTTRFDGSLSDNNTPETFKTITDAQLNTIFKSGNRDTNTSKQNTGLICAAGDASVFPAAWHCKNITVDGVGELALPRIQILARLYCEALAIDAIDPTVSSHPDYALAKIWDSAGPIQRVWASTDYLVSNAYLTYYNGYCYQLIKTNTCGVIPVQEL